MNIDEYIQRQLQPSDRKTASDFIKYLRSRRLSFYKDESDCWKNKIYYWVKYKDECVCFIAITDPDEPENLWTVWSADLSSGVLENYPVDDSVAKTAWRYVDHCGHCGSCGGGRHRIIFGKEFNDVCGCTFRIDNPDTGDMPFLRKIVEIRLKEIQ